MSTSKESSVSMTRIEIVAMLKKQNDKASASIVNFDLKSLYSLKVVEKKNCLAGYVGHNSRNLMKIRGTYMSMSFGSAIQYEVMVTNKVCAYGIFSSLL